MLSSITLGQFKSYKEAKLPLAPLTVLIGANASGKSNAIEAMRFLSRLARGQSLRSLQYDIQDPEVMIRGRVQDLFYRGGTSFYFECEYSRKLVTELRIEFSSRDDGLHIVDESIRARGYEVPYYKISRKTTGKGTDVKVQYNNFLQGGRKPQIVCSDQYAIFTQLTTPAAFNEVHADSRRTIPALARAFEKWLSAMLFLDPVPARMRDYVFRTDTRLKGDGSNTSGILCNLWGVDSSAQNEPFKTQRDDILGFVRSLPEQDISNVFFLEEPRGGVMVKLTENFGGNEQEYDASLLSDGTLRVLSIAAAMLSADEGSLVVIEEIDNGVHPSRARHLLDRILAIAKRRNLRVLLSTHNPALMDALPNSAIPDVVFCYRDMSDGSSKLVSLSDISDYPELVAQGSLGHLVTSGVLERFVKQQRKGSEREERALQWLKNMRAGNES